MGTTDTNVEHFTELTEGDAPLSPGFVNPVPVYAVEPLRTQELPPRNLAVGQWPVPVGSAVRVGSAHVARFDLVVLNTGAVTVYLGPTEGTATLTSGFPIAAGASMRISARCDVFLGVDPAGAAGKVATCEQQLDGGLT